ELPIDGLTDVSDVPKNLVFDARSLFFASQEQEMVTPGSRQAKGFAIQICAILKTVPGLVLGESRVFLASRVLTEKTIHRYVDVNDKVGGEADTDAPRVKKTPVKKAVSHKRPAIDIETDPVVKKKRTTKGKPLKRKQRLIVEDDLEVDEPMAGGSTAEHPIEEAATDVQEPVPESVEQPAVVPIVAPATDDPGAVIKKVLNQLDVVFRTDDGEQRKGTVVEETVVAANETQGPAEERHCDTDEEVETMDVGAAGGDQQVLFSAEEPEDVVMSDVESSLYELIDADEKMSLEDILMTIPVDVQLPFAGIEITKITMGKEIKIPGVDERTRYLASLPQIPVDNKGKAILVEKDPVKGNPAKEHYSLICADIDLLVHLRAQVSADSSSDDVMLYVGIEVADVSFAAGSLVDSRRFRLLFWTVEVALDSSRRALSPYTFCRGCCWLEQKHEVAVRVRRAQYRTLHLPAGIVATMHRVVNYHSSWARQQQVELFDASGNRGSTAGRGFNPAGGAPGELSKKEERVYCWGETETTHVAVNRKRYVLLKYREVLVRKFLESWKNNFVPGGGSSATDLKVIDMLSDHHLFVLEELRAQALAHGLKWTRTCCSKIVEGSPCDRGAINARTNTNTPSTCWLRSMIRVDGVWVVEPFCDQWVKIPRPVVCNEVSRQCSFVDFFPVVSEPFRILRKRWADVCLEVAYFVVSGRLLPIGSINFCRSLSVDAPAYMVAPRQSPVFALRVSQFCTVFIDYSFFSLLPTADITDFLSSIAMDRTVFRSVQIAHNTVSVAPFVQMIDEPSSSKSSSDDILMDFVDDILMDFVGHDTTAATSHSPPTISADVQNVLAQLRASVDLIQFELLEHKDDVKKIRETLSLHINNLDRTLSDRFNAHDRTYRVLFNNVRHDMRDQKNLLSMDLKSYQQKVSIQVGAAALDIVDVERSNRGA
ncbi:hypothetical protein F511_05754, partial [Dorcoceras hygrometricum]